ncbi:MAG: hypothetical protein IPJ07_07335 [Acidobacteria bacterium]|nr:hypothetical protein [Acidobacteriota bacterium]
MRRCGNGVWAIDLISKQVTNWKANVSGLAGPAFGGDGTIYVATRSGGERPDSLVALDPKTLSVKGWYSAGNQEFSSTPVIFQYKGRALIAATTRDGRVHLLDTSNLGGSDHQTPLFATSVSSKAGDFVPGALASWQDLGGTRWILAPAIGTQAADAGFKAENGAVTKGSVVAWKIVEHGFRLWQARGNLCRTGPARKRLRKSALPATILKNPSLFDRIGPAGRRHWRRCLTSEQKPQIRNATL